MPSISRPLPRWLRIGLLAEFLLPSLLLLVSARELAAPFVPLAGPWAARLFGHSCGVDGQTPWIAWTLLGLGAVAGLLAARVRRGWALAPLALLWWPAWLATGLLSALNANT